MKIAHTSQPFCKQRIIILSLFLLFLLNPCANGQVTIGSNQAPVPGALLHLTNGDGGLSDKGLGMPRVALQKINTLAPCVDDALHPSERESHVGLMLYNTATIPAELICPGLYVWDGNLWSRLHGTCQSVKITNIQNSYVMDGLEYSFTIDAPEAWNATLIDPSGIITSTPIMSGNAGSQQFAFTLAAKTDADATARIVFSLKNNPEIKSTALINGQKMTFYVPADFQIIITGVMYTYQFTPFGSNSKRPITVKSHDFENSAIRIDLVKETFSINSTSLIVKVYHITLTNGATEATTNISVVANGSGVIPIDPEDPDPTIP